MVERTSVVVLVGAIAVAGVLAVVHSETPPPTKTAAPTLETTSGTPDLPALSPTLPPGHPSIGTMAGGHGAALSPSDEGSVAALVWTVPKAWTVAPNTSAMRLATYRVPRAAGDTEDTDVSVARAGGSVSANIDRWRSQFGDAANETRIVKTIRGVTVTEVEVHGTFEGGGMGMGSAAGSHPGWTLLAAIVQTPGEPYFFKMTGPTRSVTAARTAFDALLAGVTPTSS